ncbi:protein kinase domain-containing protein [Nannocystaceae bacterium ST9]
MQSDTEAGPARSLDATTSAGLEPLDRDGMALFERIGAKLGLSITASVQRIDRYEIRGVLGRGGMGVVYLAYDPRLQREVALKLVNAGPFNDPKALSIRLLREANVIAPLAHPNIIRVYDAGEHEGEVFVALERVDGWNLRDWQREHTPGQDHLVRVFIAAGGGLATLHAQGIVHRDFKPDNVLIARDGRVLVSDFGLAGVGSVSSVPSTAGGSSERLTRDGEVIGTPGYMPPEQLRGDAIDARSDQFAFCVSAWELLTGGRPFVVEPRQDPLPVIAKGPTGGGELPRWLRGALARGLESRPESRFADMQALVEQLELGLGRRRRWLVRGGLGLAAIITSISLVVALLSQPTPAACRIEVEFDALRESIEWQEWIEVLSSTDEINHLRRIESRIEHQVDDVCREGTPARAQQLAQWIKTLRELPELPLAEARSILRELDDARFDRPPPEPIDDEVAARLEESRRAELDDRLEDALRLTDAALERVDVLEENERPRSSERALIAMRRGRVHALLGNDSTALADYHQAELAAIAAEYEYAQLQIDLLRAKTEIMRLDRLDDGAVHLNLAEARLDLLREPYSSPRWTDFFQLRAALQMRQDASRALVDQRRVVLRGLLDHDADQVALALINLGTVHEARLDPGRAEVSYRLAIWLAPDPSPTRRQAEYDLGLLLANAEVITDAQAAESRELLESVRTADVDLRLGAAAGLVHLAFRNGSDDEIRDANAELAHLLELDHQAPPRQQFEAWASIARNQAILGDDMTLAETRARECALPLPDREDLLATFEMDLVMNLDETARAPYLASLRERLPRLTPSLRDSIEAELANSFEPGTDSPR